MKRIILAAALLSIAGTSQAAVTISQRFSEGSQTDNWNGATVDSTSGVLNGFTADDSFGTVTTGSNFPEAIAGGHTIFNDSPQTASINFTPTVSGSINRITAWVSGDGPGNTFRTFNNIAFLGSNDGVNFTPIESTGTFTQTGALRIKFNLATPVNYTSYRFEGFQPNGGGRILELDALGSVPEPATWAMMILGFGFVGGAMRYRRTARVSLAAG